MDYTVTHHESDCRIRLSGQFTFSDNAKFRQIFQMLDASPPKSLTLDFGQVDFIDSAGLGMLLLLRDECQSKHIAITIASAKGQVEKIFLISKFDQLFSMAS